MTVAVDDYDPYRTCMHRLDTTPLCKTLLWLSGLVVSALGIRARGPASNPARATIILAINPNWASGIHTLPDRQLQKTGVQKESFSPQVVVVIKCARLSEALS